jgi:hypothetical protein
MMRACRTMEPRVKACGINNESFGYHSGVWELTASDCPKYGQMRIKKKKTKSRSMICMAVDPEMQAEDSAEQRVED